MDLRNLDPIKDAALLEEAWSWNENAPRWYQRTQEVFEVSHERIAIGIFDGELVGVIFLTPRGQAAEVDLMAKRGTDVLLLGEAAAHVAHSLFNQINLNEIFCWLPKKNKAVSKVCILGGMRDDGIRMLKGSYGQRVIEWVRWSVRRESLLAEKAA